MGSSGDHGSGRARFGGGVQPAEQRSLGNAIPRRRRALGVAASLALAFSALLVVRAQIATAAGPLVVNSTADVHDASPGDGVCATDVATCTLRAAAEEANARAGTSDILLPAGTYDLTLGDLVVGRAKDTNIGIAGTTGIASQVTIRQTQAGRSVIVHNPQVRDNNILRLANLTITGGNESSSDPDGIGGWGGAFIGGAPVGNAAYIDNVIFAGNHTTANAPGGAISWSYGGNLVITNSTFSANYAGGPDFGSGGAIDFQNGSLAGALTISNSVFENNMIAAPEGWGGAISFNGVNNTMTVTGTTFTGNLAAQYGGAIWIGSGAATLTGNRIVGNSAAAQSGVAVTGTAVAAGQDNWWGCNAGPQSAKCDGANGTLASAPWADLHIDAGQTLIPSGGWTPATVSFVRHGTGAATDPSLFNAVARVPVSWSVSGGTLSNEQPYVGPAGTADAEFSGSGCGTSGTIKATVDNETVQTTIQVDCPNLAISKTNDIGSAGVVGQQWKWMLTAGNHGTIPATFQSGQVVLTDDLGTSVVVNGPPFTAKTGLTCGVVIDKLSCVADGPLTIVPGEDFAVVLAVASPNVGVVPDSSSICMIDPDAVIFETTETDNACSDSVTVNAASTTIGITSVSPSPATVGIVRFSYTLSPVFPANGTPTGPVTIREVGGDDVCTDAANAGYCDATFTSAGGRSLIASYGGSASFLPSVSMPFDLDVGKASTATRIISIAPEPSVVGHTVHVAFGVTSVGGTPAGNVTVSAGTDTCTGTVAAGGCDIVFTSAGSKSVVATYAGDSNFLAGASVSESHVVVPQAPDPTATPTATGSASASSTASANGTGSATASATGHPSMTPPPTAASGQPTAGGDAPVLVALLLLAAAIAIALCSVLPSGIERRRRQA